MSASASLEKSIPTWPRPAGGELPALEEVLSSGAWGSATGQLVRDFEQQFARYHSARHGIACANGTVALAAALAVLDLPPGSEVVVPSYTFFATAAAPALLGFVPVFCDVTPDGYLLDPAALEAVIGPDTAAVIPVHLAGALCDLDAILAIARRHGLAVIEDAAQASGGSYRGRGIPSGDLATFSFQSSKNLASGEGGAILTNDDRLAEGLFGYLNVGRIPGGAWYQHETFGLNLRLSEFQGAVLTAQFSAFPQLQQRRTANAARLHDLLRGTPGLDLPPVGFDDGTVHGQHLFLIRFPGLGAARRNRLLSLLQQGGLRHASSGYIPLHRNQPLLEKARGNAAAAGRTFREPSCPHTDQRVEETIWLPQPVLLAEPEVLDQVAELITTSLATVLEER
ncbi:MAG: DegT/DnrJ/EryC1/StrS family aminotransferase [Propionicimonas sp.]